MANGHNFLFATNFHSGQVETFNENFQRVNRDGFVDPKNLSNLIAIGGRLPGQLRAATEGQLHRVLVFSKLLC